MNHSAHTAFRIGDRIIHAATLAEATKIATLRAAAEERHAAKMAAEASRKAAAAAARKAERDAARDTAERKRASDAAFEREFAALLAEETRELSARSARIYWLTGEGDRPDISWPERAPVAGEPLVQITARPRPGVGAPFVGEGSQARPDHGVRAAHEYVPERVAAPVWNPRASAV